MINVQCLINQNCIQRQFANRTLLFSDRNFSSNIQDNKIRTCCSRIPHITPLPTIKRNIRLNLPWGILRYLHPSDFVNFFTRSRMAANTINVCIIYFYKTNPCADVKSSNSHNPPQIGQKMGF